MAITVNKTQAFILGFYRGWFLASAPSAVLLFIASCLRHQLWPVAVFSALGGGFAWWGYHDTVSGILETARKERLKLLYPEE
jgi:hypothetical protein